MDVQDSCDRISLASQCGKIVKGAFDDWKVERTFLSAHIHQTETSESCFRTHHDSPPSPPLEEGRRYLLDHLSPALRQKDLSPRPPLLRGEGESNEALRKHEKGRQECLPHLHTRILNGSTSLYAGVALIDWRIKQLNVTIACINQAYYLRKRVDP